MKHPRNAAPSTIEDAPMLLVRAVDIVLFLRVPILLGCVVLAALAVGPSRRLEFDRSLEALFTEGDPRLVSYLEAKEVFGGAETGIIAYTDPQLLTAEGLLRLERLDAVLRKVRGIENVLSLAQAKLPGAPLSSLSLREHLEEKTVSPVELRAELVGCELYRGRLLSEDGQTTVLLVSFAAGEADIASRDTTIEHVRAICDEHQPPAVLAGGPVLVNDVYEHLEQDGRTLGVASSLVLAIIIAVLFRNLRWIVLPLAVVHLTLVWTKAVLVVGGMRLSMVSSPLVALVTVIGTATVVHVTIRFREERVAHQPTEALRRTLIHISPAIFWTCLTTAVGFSSLLASRVAPVGSFGSMMALGASLVFVAAMGLLPAGVLLGRYGTDPARAPGERHVASLLNHLVAAVERRPWHVAAFGIGLLALTSVGIFKLEVATEFDENFRQSSPIVKSYHFVSDRMGTTETVDVLIDVQNLRGKELDELLETVRTLQSELKDEKGVVSTLSLVDVLDFMTGTRKDRADVASWLAAFSLEKMSAAERLEFLRVFQPDLIAGFWNQDRGVMRIIVQSGGVRGTTEKLRLVDAIEGRARERFPEARVAGVAILLTYLVKSLLADQWITFGLAVAAIVVMLMLAFRDWRLGLIALIPNAAPILIVVGVMGWMGLKVNVATAMLASVSMGLAVDFSIHYLYRFQHELRGGKTFNEAIRDAHNSVGLAMVLANIALVAGFSTLVISAFMPTVHFGLLVSVAMLGGLAGNLISLPLLLRSFLVTAPVNDKHSEMEFAAKARSGDSSGAASSDPVDTDLGTLSFADVLRQPELWLTDLQRRWLRPRSVFARIVYSGLYIVNWVSVRLLFRLSVEGRDQLPVSGPFIIAPNHASPLDPPMLAAAFRLTMLQQTFWAGKQSSVLRNRLRRILSWLTRVIPIADDASALAPGVTILERGHILVWFPEGKRSLDGRLQEFKPGIAHLLMRCDVPVFPVFIHGAYAAFPSGAWLPRLRANVVVRIGPALSAEQLGLEGSTVENVNAVADRLRQHVVRLRDEADAE